MWKTVLAVLSAIASLISLYRSAREKSAGRAEAAVEQAVEGKKVADAVREVAETPVSDDELLKRLRDGSA